MALEFLDMIESLRADEASPARLYGGEGTRARRTNVDARYSAKLLEAAKLYQRVLQGDRRAALTFQEALTTSDFPYLFGDILDRQILANYAETAYTWDQIARKGTVRDFRTVKRFVLNGSETVLDEVPEQTEYPESTLSDGSYTYSVKKYGRRVPFSWEAMLNDDLDTLKDLPARLGKAARRSEEKFATALYAGASGPLGTVFTSGNKNIINSTNGASATNPPLSISALQDAFIVLGRMLDNGGDPIMVDGVTLVVPPALEVVAQNILNATALTIGGFGTSATAQQITTANWLARKVKLAVNYYLPIVSTTNGNTSWYLFANPSSGRPALEIGHLLGHETPEIFIKSPNAMRVGGGLINPMDGDFDLDSIVYKVRHVFGGGVLEPRSVVASNGTGS